MTDFPTSLLEHLGGEATTVCACWRVTRRDGTVLGFTDHDGTLTIEGVDFRPETGLSASEAQSSLGLAVDAAEVEGALSADAITDADIAAGRYDGAAVETLMVNWRSPADHAVLRKATIGRIVRRDGRYVAELRSATAALDEARPLLVTRRCQAALGDARCGVDLDDPAFAGSGSVAVVRADGRIVVEGLDAFAGGWFEHGTLTATGGVHAGLDFPVIGHERQDGETVLAFWAPRPGFAPGDPFTIVAGCDKRFETCRTKFDNVLNFRGFPHLPGNDAAYGYVNGAQLFDGGPVVP